MTIGARPGVKNYGRWYNQSIRECSYDPTVFKDMINRHTGLLAAKRVIIDPKMPSGFATLWEKNRFDLTVEAQAIKLPWCRLFEPDELRKARRRLRDSGYADLACPCLDQTGA